MNALDFTRLPQLQLGALVLLGAGLFAVTYVGAISPPLEARRLGLRGLKRQRALEDVPFWGVVEPVLRWLAARVSRFLSQEAYRKLDHKIALAGDYLGLVPQELVALSVLTSFVGLVGGYFLGRISGMGNMVVTAGVLLGIVFPFMRISSTAAERLKGIDRRLPYAIDLLSLAMGAGLDFPGAVRQTVEKAGKHDDPVVEEFTMILQSLQLGRTRRHALEEFAARAPIDSVMEFVGAVVQADLRGNPVVDVLRIQADVARRKRTVRAEEAAAKAGVAMLGPLVLVFLCILILIVAPMVMRVQGSGL
jgi:tight adherence protein C